MDETLDLSAPLRQSPLFSALNDEQLARVVDAANVLSLETGEHLFEFGQPASHFFLLLSGQIKLYRLSPAGNEKVIEIVQPGQTFAEAVMFMDRQDFPVSAQALGEVEVVSIANKAFSAVLRESVDTCFRVMGDMSVRLRQRLNEIDALTLQNATLRMVNFLLYQCPDGHGNCVKVQLPAAKHVVASQLSIQPETLSRILGNLSTRGLISVQGLDIVIHDVEGLRNSVD